MAESRVISHPPIEKSDTKDSISSADSDVNLFDDRRGSVSEIAEQSDGGFSHDGDKEGKTILGKDECNSSDRDSGFDTDHISHSDNSQKV